MTCNSHYGKCRCAIQIFISSKCLRAVWLLTIFHLRMFTVILLNALVDLFKNSLQIAIENRILNDEHHKNRCPKCWSIECCFPKKWIKNKLKKLKKTRHYYHRFFLEAASGNSLFSEDTTVESLMIEYSNMP